MDIDNAIYDSVQNRKNNNLISFEIIDFVVFSIREYLNVIFVYFIIFTFNLRRLQERMWSHLLSVINQPTETIVLATAMQPASETLLNGRKRAFLKTPIYYQKNHVSIEFLSP